MTTYDEVKNAFNLGLAAIPPNITASRLEEVLDSIPDGQEEEFVNFVIANIHLAA